MIENKLLLNQISTPVIILMSLLAQLQIKMLVKSLKSPVVSIKYFLTQIKKRKTHKCHLYLPNKIQNYLKMGLLVQNPNQIQRVKPVMIKKVQVSSLVKAMMKGASRMMMNPTLILLKSIIICPNKTKNL